MESADNLKPLKINDLKEGEKIYLGKISFTEEEIIRFGKEFDPLPFHVDKEKAKESRFGGLVASGPHLFVVVHRERGIPLIGHTIIAGMEVNNWKMIRPVHPNQAITSYLTPVEIKKNPEKNHAVIKWFYEFWSESKELVQSLEVTVLHKI